MSKEQEKIIASQKELLKEYEKENAELFENCKDKDRQLNNWFVSYNEVKKENAELKAQIEPLLERITNLRRNYTSLQKENESLRCCGNCNKKWCGKRIKRLFGK